MTTPAIIVALVSIPHLGVEEGQKFRAEIRGNGASAKVRKGVNYILKQYEWRLASHEEIAEFEENEANPGGERVEAKAVSEINDGSKPVEPIEKQPDLDTEQPLPNTGVGAPPINPNQPALVEVAQNDAAAAGVTEIEEEPGEPGDSGPIEGENDGPVIEGDQSTDDLPEETQDDSGPTDAPVEEAPVWDDAAKAYVNPDGTIQQPQTDERRSELGLPSMGEWYEGLSEQERADVTLTGNETEEELEAKGFTTSDEASGSAPTDENDDL